MKKRFNYMLIIIRAIIEAKIDRLIQKRENAIENGDYERAWLLRMEIDKYVTRMINVSYLTIGV